MISSARASYVLFLLTSVYTLSFLDRNIINILVDPIKNELHLSDTTMGFLAGFAFLLVYSGLGIPVGRWADRSDRRKIIALGVGIWSLMTALSGFAQSTLQLTVARAGVGIGESAAAAPAQSLVADCFPGTSRARAMSVYSTGLYLGQFLGYFFGGWITQYYGWRTAFVCAGIPGLVLAFLVRFTTPDPPRGGDSGQGSSNVLPVKETLRFLVSQKSFVFLTIGFCLTSYTNFTLAVWIPSFLRRIHHLNSAQIGTYAGTLKGVMGIIGVLLGGWIADRISKKGSQRILYAPAIGSVVAGVLFAAFLMAKDVTTALAAFGAATLIGALQLGPVWAVVQMVVQVRMRATAAACVLMISNVVAAGAGPLLVGMTNDWLQPRFGVGAVRYSLLVSALASVLGGIAFVFSWRRMPQDLIRAAEPGLEALTETSRS